MSGVWVFDSDGVYRLEEIQLEESSGTTAGCKVLVHKATNMTMTCYEQLHRILLELGWCSYFRNESIRQYHRGNDSPDLITLPSFFSNLRTTHMYDIVVKTRSAFEVRDAD